MAKQDSGKLYTFSKIAIETSLHRSAIPGLLIGLGITPRKAGSSFVITQDELNRVKARVESARQTQTA